MNELSEGRLTKLTGFTSSLILASLGSVIEASDGCERDYIGTTPPLTKMGFRLSLHQRAKLTLVRWSETNKIPLGPAVFQGHWSLGPTQNSYNNQNQRICSDISSTINPNIYFSLNKIRQCLLSAAWFAQSWILCALYKIVTGRLLRILKVVWWFYYMFYERRIYPPSGKHYKTVTMSVCKHRVLGGR